jgi:hypothetical protein
MLNINCVARAQAKSGPGAKRTILPDQLRPSSFDGMRMLYLDHSRDNVADACLARSKLGVAAWAPPSMLRPPSPAREAAAAAAAEQLLRALESRQHSRGSASRDGSRTGSRGRGQDAAVTLSALLEQSGINVRPGFEPLTRTISKFKMWSSYMPADAADEMTSADPVAAMRAFSYSMKARGSGVAHVADITYTARVPVAMLAAPAPQ